jgi:hypothetical protein
MSEIFKKLNFKNHSNLLVLNAPDSFLPELAGLSAEQVKTDLDAVNAIDFSLAFVTQPAQVEALAPQIARKAQGDAPIWFAYPKGRSKKYQTSLNRDNGWECLGREGYEVVRLVAIDADWSALRFRRTAYIKSLTRTSLPVMSEAGKQRLADAKNTDPAEPQSPKKFD